MAKVICTMCGSTGNVKRVTNGSLLIELVLWLCFFVPGLIYSIWRMTTRHNACAFCGSKAVVPLDSPVGARLMKQFASGE